MRSSIPLSDDPNLAIEIWPLQMSEHGFGGLNNEDAEFLLQLPDEGDRRGLVMFYVAAGKVPDVWIPSSASRAMTKEHRFSLDEEASHDVMNTRKLAAAHRSESPTKMRPSPASGNPGDIDLGPMALTTSMRGIYRLQVVIS